MQEEQAALKAQGRDQGMDYDKAAKVASRKRPLPTTTSDQQSDDSSGPADAKQAAPDKLLPQQKSAATPAADTQRDPVAPAEEDDRVRCPHML